MIDGTSILIALIVAVPTVLSTTLVPLMIKRADNQTRREERAEDKAELKLAAEKAEEVAEQAKEAARLLAENTVKAEKATQSLVDKVDVVHVLVNSNLTLATQKLLESKEAHIELLRQYTPENLSIIKQLELEIVELNSVLADRRAQAIKVGVLEKQQDKE